MDACIQNNDFVFDMSTPSFTADATSRWVPNPAWKIESLNGYVVVNGGADEVYVVDEAPAEAHSQLIDVCLEGRAREWQHDPSLGAAVRQLRRLGALVPAGAIHPDRPALFVQWAGRPLPALLTSLESHGWTCLSTPSAEQQMLTLLVRTTASWSELCGSYQDAPLAGTHVLLDLAYHHTLGIGPMVVPGQTACLACMGHRVMRRWGDLPMPDEPAMLRRAAGVAALLADAAVLGSRLIERAFTLDLRTLRMDSSTVFAQPECPVCASMCHKDAVRSATLRLPWLVTEQGATHDQAAHSI
jgi:bacteriocin biosynthesis cyclodehydratase domain-containing protein